MKIEQQLGLVQDNRQNGKKVHQILPGFTLVNALFVLNHFTCLCLCVSGGDFTATLSAVTVLQQ